MTKDNENILQDTDFLKNLIVAIGEVAKITGIPTRQIRYWEEKGIITSIEDIDSKARCYDYLEIKKIIIIKEMLDEGYTLDAAGKKIATRMEQINKIFKAFKE